MAYFKTSDGAVHWLDEGVEPGSVAGFPHGAEPISDAAAADLLRVRGGGSDAFAWSVVQARAQTALDASDITLLRCVEHGVAVPPEWVAYRAALRSIVGTTSGDPAQGLPTRPAYPAGT